MTGRAGLVEGIDCIAEVLNCEDGAELSVYWDGNEGCECFFACVHQLIGRDEQPFELMRQRAVTVQEALRLLELEAAEFLEEHWN